uniref:Putative DNA polymerase family X n=1 Tax=Lygus hesperus TaxID=30085 RepID=A0A0A9YZS5_LYGHE
MGICRLRSSNHSSSSTSGRPKLIFTARRIDVRFVDASSYPAALLYFTGSKNFNVFVRSEALKKHFILNEYGLFRNPSPNMGGAGKLHEMISRLAKANYY